MTEPVPAQGAASSLFSGRHRLKIDEKGRLTLPSAFRRAFPDGTGDEVVLLPGPDGYIQLLSRAEWEARVGRATPAAGVQGAELRRWRRAIFTQAEIVALDEKGRMTIPQEMLDIAEITRDVLAAGVGSAVELWNPDRWHDYQQQKAVDLSSVMDVLF